MPEMTSFEAEALGRLPLASAFWEASAHLLDQHWLAGFAARHGADGFPDLLGFGRFLDLVGDALLLRGGSLNAAYRKAAEAGPVPATRQALYGKLRRVPLALSASFLREAAARLGPLAAPAPALPACLDALDVLVMDGKKLKRVAKRLAPCRGAPGKLFGGKLLVAWRPRTGLAAAMEADPDGQANECRLVPGLLGQFDGGPPRLWVADRQFGDLVQPARVLASGGHFLFRLNRKTGFKADPGRPAEAGVDAEGRPFTESWGRLGKAGNGPEARLIRLDLGGGGVLEVVTDLLDAAAYPAADLLGLYRMRWGIERVFQRITEVFGLARFIGSSPEATVFQAAYCLVIYDLVEVIKGHAAADGRTAPDAVSTENLFEDVREELATGHRMLGAARLAALVPVELDAARMAARLRALLAGSWRRGWRKAADEKPRPPRQKARGSGAHDSVHRLQQKHLRKAERP